ncbi:anti-sigma factor family protein [Paraliomyxa miuraensis]|uniref:anti-sigma factor family protein n=1 Tax=Paraliomyxa miuraensis TaxID=376150 RepID=UPI00224E56A7|nr:hypothetical protein [Paraliomyxa miuraensis]MCX4242627.1 hypothetical protein [Paraliomyxa miuraensis]
MHCHDCEPLLIDHACAQTDDPIHTEVARHLAGCSVCALEYCRLRADLAGIVEAHAEAPHARVYTRLRRQVAAEVRPRWWTRSWHLLLRPIPAYGAVLVGLLPLALWVASSLTRDSGPPPTTDPLGMPPAASLSHYDAISLPPAHRDVL